MESRVEHDALSRYHEHTARSDQNDLQWEGVRDVEVAEEVPEGMKYDADGRGNEGPEVYTAVGAESAQDLDDDFSCVEDPKSQEDGNDELSAVAHDVVSTHAVLAVS